METNKPKHQVVHAYEKGYRIIDGEIHNPKKKILRGYINDHGYRRFTIYINGKTRDVKYHLLCAYQKFGEIIFQKNIVVRHLDNDKLNNKESNIATGSSKDNCLDIPKEVRSKRRKNASETRRRLKDPNLIAEIYKFIAKNKMANTKIAKEFNIDRKTVASLIKKYNEQNS